MYTYACEKHLIIYIDYNRRWMSDYVIFKIKYTI